MKYKYLTFIISFLIFNYAYSAADLNLIDAEDLELLDSTSPVEEDVKLNFDEVVEDDVLEISDDSFVEEKANEDLVELEKMNSSDDLEELKDDVGEIEFNLPDEIEKDLSKKVKIGTKGLSKKEKLSVFDVGKEEKELVQIAKKMTGKIPDREWNEIAGKSIDGTYEVVENDWLWKISQKLFGSGFYYAKIWALNPYITNPHEIEPGMILVFSTGSEGSLPSLTIEGDAPISSGQIVTTADGEFEKYGEDVKPSWVEERKNLKSQGVFFQYSSADTIEDLQEVGEDALNNEYESYDPPPMDFELEIPVAEYDDGGFDKNSKIFFDYKDGFDLNTFVSTNIVQDFGKIESSYSEQGIFSKTDIVYVRFDEKLNISPGDKFSIYISQGKMSHINSDRKGFQYTVEGSIEVIQKQDDLWEAKIIESRGEIGRGDRITVYTPKLESITKTYNPRLIEAILVGAHTKGLLLPSFGDVVYIDRGRADGVEIGNVFEVYGFKDRGTGRNITDNPAYKNGELTVITLTENFATAIVTNSKRDFTIGDVAISKTKDAAAKMLRLKNQLKGKNITSLDDEALDELDVELNLDDLNDSLLDKADEIQFTEDELAELERQERERSIINENEKDLKALERLESEIESAEKILRDSKLDEDRLLQNQSLDKVEGKLKIDQQETIEEIEENFGKRYLDEDLNDKENPYGLTEFDIEEIDELLNVEGELE